MAKARHRDALALPGGMGRTRARDRVDERAATVIAAARTMRWFDFAKGQGMFARGASTARTVRTFVTPVTVKTAPRLMSPLTARRRLPILET